MRKKIVRCLACVCLVAVLAAILVTVGKRRTGLQFVRDLGAGINIGNSLEAVGLLEKKPDASVEKYETYWDNPVITRELFEMIAARGFRTVRIPVNWGEHLDEKGNIKQEWMARVTEVVDWALEEDLYVILDMHHEKWLIPTEENEIQDTAQLCRIWRQIAENFSDRDEHLLFESMNEPRLEDSDEEWTSGTTEMQQVVNRLNAAFVETVRGAGGENKNRWLLIPAYCSQYRREALEALEIPQDDKIIVSVHAYVPYSFTLGDDEDAVWDADSAEDTARIDTIMEDFEELFLKNGIPVAITEFGCQEKDNESMRLAWVEYYTQAAEEKGIPCIWWDNGKDSAVMNREYLQWTEDALVSIMLKSYE